MAHLKALADIVSNGIDKIEAAVKAKNTVFPSLDEPFNADNEAIRTEVFADAVPVIAAAHQLIATLQLPAVSAATSALYVSPHPLHCGGR